MSNFIKVTEIRREQYGNYIGSTYIDVKIPRLVNVNCIVSVEDGVIYFADFKMRVAESLEQIQKLIEIEDETRTND